MARRTAQLSSANQVNLNLGKNEIYLLLPMLENELPVTFDSLQESIVNQICFRFSLDWFSLGKRARRTRTIVRRVANHSFSESLMP